MNPLPPQAYTKETLLKAYSWVMNQNASIKDMATTPDILVSLYLKTTRDGESALDRPSIQNFKKELKSLAGMMGELDKSPAVELPQLSALPNFQAETSKDLKTSPKIESNTQAPSDFKTPKENKSESVEFVKSDIKNQLDPLSLAMIHEVKNEFNLSSDTEALRMLIKIGYNKAQALF